MQMSNRNSERAVRLMLAFLLALVIPFNLHADDGDGNAEHWIAVGSTGTVDESDLGRVGFYQGVAFNGSTGTTTLRYNVTPTDDLFGGNTTRFAMRYLDAGNCTRVEACLFRYSLNNGTITQLMTINSDSFIQANAFQTRFIDSASLPAFDFDNFGYFVEVYLTDNCGTGGARIGLLRLNRF
jgi:hypothetical protein